MFMINIWRVKYFNEIVSLKFLKVFNVKKQCKNNVKKEELGYPLNLALLNDPNFTKKNRDYLCNKENNIDRQVSLRLINSIWILFNSCNNC